MTPPLATRAQLRLDVQNIADAFGSQHWDFSGGGEVDRRLGQVHMQEWRRILNASPYYQIATITANTDTTGSIPLSTLSTGTGDNQQNLYRILVVANGLTGSNALQYREIKLQQIQQYLTLSQQGFVYYVWYRNGQQITIPGNLTQQVNIWVNWTPTRFDLLASDSSLVQLPDDYGDIFAHEGAARILMKGAAETEASAELKGLAENLRADRLQDLARLGIAPWSVATEDHPFDWGAV